MAFGTKGYRTSKMKFLCRLKKTPRNHNYLWLTSSFKYKGAFWRLNRHCWGSKTYFNVKALNLSSLFQLYTCYYTCEVQNHVFLLQPQMLLMLSALLMARKRMLHNLNVWCCLLTSKARFAKQLCLSLVCGLGTSELHRGSSKGCFGCQES